ncbi:MAG TPA: peptidoglycan DD-metalloendopeptidase family protein [Gemmatimonadales bacterium]|nr:peptidoglycan DD-metalloendopeptidase family protein [Gemmatimonadales bacterium]
MSSVAAAPANGMARVFVLLVIVLASAPVAPVRAQQPDIEASRKRLEDIRAERDRLRREQDRLESQVRNTGAELNNIERQKEVTNRLVNELERQMRGLGDQLGSSSQQLALAQDNLADRRAVLERRLVDIYKRGPLHTFQVLLTAETFGDLLTRYKYLYLQNRQDRSLVEDIRRLEGRIRQRRGELVNVQEDLDRRREERASELRSYQALAEERTARLGRLKKTSEAGQQRLSQLEKDEARLNDLLASLSTRKSTRIATPSAPGGTELTTAELGSLDWPVSGRILFRFGRDTLPSGAVIRRNGIGIAAPLGTPVKAVSSGRVALVQRLGTYGLTVVLEHGNGYFSLYMQLASASVAKDAMIQKGETIGTVGGDNTDQGPHLYFEIRGENQIALDPTDWLRRR